MKPRRLAVLGGGWAGLSAAVYATLGGAEVTVLEMAGHWGGRARCLEGPGMPLDNGQHILIGAYTATLALMQQVGADPTTLLQRRPLQLMQANGQGLTLPPGPPALAFARAVWAHPEWSLALRLALLRFCTSLALRGFRCAPRLNVAELIATLPVRLQRELFEPLCIAALNTQAAQASAAVFLRVLKDALFSTSGGSDLLLPRVGLSELLPQPAVLWLAAQPGTELRLRTEVKTLHPEGNEWRVNDERFDGVILACTPWVAARLVAPLAPPWAADAEALRHSAIATVYVQHPSARLPAPMVALDDAGGQAPAQFAFDLGRLLGRSGLIALVASGADAWAARGRDALAAAACEQMRTAMPQATWAQSLQATQTTIEKRATFVCSPGLKRPSAHIAPGLWAAGDYVQGPYPATLEGAVRSGQFAAAQALAALQQTTKTDRFNGGRTAPPAAHQ